MDILGPLPETAAGNQSVLVESKVMSEVCSLLGIEKTRTTPLNPKSDGMIKRFNRTMIDVVQALLDPRKNQRDWDEVLPYAMMAYRSSIQDSTGETPYVMTYGEEIMLPVDLFGVPENPEQDDELLMDCARELRQRLSKSSLTGCS